MPISEYVCFECYQPRREIVAILHLKPQCLHWKAKASGIALLVGAGSYLAYQLCLKLYDYSDFSSLLNRLCQGSDNFEKSVDKRQQELTKVEQDDVIICCDRDNGDQKTEKVLRQCNSATTPSKSNTVFQPTNLRTKWSTPFSSPFRLRSSPSSGSRTKSISSVSTQSEKFMWDSTFSPNTDLFSPSTRFSFDFPFGDQLNRSICKERTDSTMSLSPGPSDRTISIGDRSIDYCSIDNHSVDNRSIEDNFCFSSTPARVLGHSTAESFERLQSDLRTLKNDMQELDDYLTVYLQNRRNCFSDNRQFYRSVVLDDGDLSSSEPGAQLSKSVSFDEKSIKSIDAGYFSSHSISDSVWPSIDEDEEMCNLDKDTTTVQTCSASSSTLGKVIELRNYFNDRAKSDLETGSNIDELIASLTNQGYRQILVPNAIATLTKMCNFDSLVAASILAVAHFRLPIFKRDSLSAVLEALDVLMTRSDDVTQWCFPYQSTDVEQTRSDILLCMQKLWELHKLLQSSDETLFDSWSAILNENSILRLTFGLKILMTLRLWEIRDVILYTGCASNEFYTNFFHVYKNPSLYCKNRLFSLGSEFNDLDVALLADTLGVCIKLVQSRDLSHQRHVHFSDNVSDTTNVSTTKLSFLENDQNGARTFLLLI